MAMKTLSPEASGLRHLRWAREIAATLDIHYEHNPRLEARERDLVLAEVMKLRGLVKGLSEAVKLYRDFLERDRTRFRGMQRVGRFLAASARTSDERAEAEMICEGFDEAFRSMEAREKAPRKQALRAAILGLREGLAGIDRRLAAGLPAGFVESLYPDLAAGGTIVADAGDPDDDSTAGPDAL
jgi:hypothetical protein